jgi:hypothetical protein
VCVAISAYRRQDTLAEVLRSLPGNGVTDVYIGVDAAPASSPDAAAVMRVVDTAAHFGQREDHDVQVHVRQAALPLGLGANVLATASWLFHEAPEGIFLEDDCVPGSGFFEFVRQALPLISGDERLWLACGSQYLKLPLAPARLIMSPYPLIWGWATTSARWRGLLDATYIALIQSLQDPLLLRGRMATIDSFWESGLREVASGRFDTWDLPIVAAMQRSGAKALLPSRNLVTNIGDDLGSVNIRADNPWTRNLSENWPRLESPEVAELSRDQIRWLETHVHLVRHPSVTRARLASLRRMLPNHSRERPSLLERWGIVSDPNRWPTAFRTVLP